MLRRGYGVVYVAEAVSWTETPATVRGFLRQQRRWKRGYIRESIYTLSYAWRNKRLLFIQILLWDLTAPSLSFGLRIALAVTVMHDPSLVLRAIIPSWIVLMLVRYIFVPLRAPRKLLGLFLYMLFYEGCLYRLQPPGALHGEKPELGHPPGHGAVVAPWDVAALSGAPARATRSRVPRPPRRRRG